MDTAHEEVVKAPRKSFRRLIENLELAYRFGAPDELDSAINDLLAHVKLDTYKATIRQPFEKKEEIIRSPYTEVVLQKLCKYEGLSSTGASVEVICGHCGNINQNQTRISGGEYGPHHIKFVLDNFPEEL